MSELSTILRGQEKLGVNTRAYSYQQFKQLALLSPQQTQSSMFPDLMINKQEKREMIKSLLKYNPNKPQESKRIKLIEQELKQKFMRKNQSEQRIINNNTINSSNNNDNNDQVEQQQTMYTEEQLQQLTIEQLRQLQQLHQQQQQYQQQQQSLLLQQQLQESQSMTVIKNMKELQQYKQFKMKKGKVLYEELQNQFKDYVVRGGQSNYKFYAQKKMQMRNTSGGIFSPQNINTTLSPLGQISNLKTQIAPTEKAKRFIFDKSSMNKSTQKMGIHLPSPLVFKNQIGLVNQSQLKRYEHVIGKLQQLALRLDLNKSQLDYQRPILRNFVELHQIQMPEGISSDLYETMQIEEKIIQYVEGRKFLEVNDQMKQLKSIEDHFEFAVHGQIKENMLNNTLEMSKNISMNQTQNINFMTQPLPTNRENSQQRIVYNEGCGVALVNEKMGKFDTQTIQYFEVGISLKKVLGYMKVVADIKNYVILEGHLLKIYKFQENEESKNGKWVILNVGQNLDFRFDSKTLYALSAYQKMTNN